MEKFKLAVLGGGLNSIAGYPHFAAARLDNRFEIKAGLFSRNPDINRKTAKQWDVEKYFDSFEDFLDEARKLDAVLVLTPTPSHYKYVSTLLKENIPVICEKPLFKSLEEIYQLKKEIKNIDKKFLVITYNYIAYPMLIELREIIKSGELGDIINIHLEMPQESFLRPPQNIDYPPLWRKIDGKIPTIALDLLSHLYSIMYFLTEKEVESISSLKSRFSKFNVIDDIKVLTTFKDKTTGLFWVSKVALGNRNGLKVSVYGTKGAAYWIQENPEVLKLSYDNGNTVLLDRGSKLKVANKKLFNRMTPGHPSGFIEALANLYTEIYNALKEYKEKGKISDNPLIWTFSKEEKNFEFLSKV